MRSVFKLLKNISYPRYRNKSGLLIHAHSPMVQRNRPITISIPLNIKKFMESENIYAYSIMTNKGYGVKLNIENDEKILSEQQFNHLIKSNWSELSAHELYKIFPKFGAYCTENNLCISDKMFDDYIDTLTDCITHASDQELTTLFYSLNKWPPTPFVRTRNFIEVWAALDDECFKRLSNWSFDKMLLYLTLFYMLNVTRLSDFCKKSLQKLATRAKQLTPAQVVQTMFFIGIFRKPPFDMHNLEIYIENNFTEFNLDELAILSMGFFKSKTPIRSMELVKKIIDKMAENSTQIHEVSLAALLKIIRYSKKINNDDTIYQMLDVFQHEIPRLSVMCNVHLALVGTSTLTFHEGCLDKIANASMSNISLARLKDLERIVLSYAMFNYIPKTNECFFSNIINELRKSEREDEITKYGRSFICCLQYLGVLGFYPVDLLNKALSSDHLEKTYGKQSHAYGREVLAVNNMASIFCKESKINLLSTKDVNVVAKRHTDYVPDENFSKQYNVTEKMFMDVIKILRESRGGAEYVTGNHVLSHHQRGDIILCNDPNGNPVPVTGMFDNKKFGVIYPPPNDNKWIVLVIAGRNSIIYKSDLPNGHYIAKIRELKAIGYHPALVLWNIYSACKSREEKLEYFNSLICNINKCN